MLLLRVCENESRGKKIRPPLIRDRNEMVIPRVAGVWILPNVTITFYYGNYCLYCYEDSRNVIWQANTKILVILCS